MNECRLQLQQALYCKKNAPPKCVIDVKVTERGQVYMTFKQLQTQIKLRICTIYYLKMRMQRDCCCLVTQLSHNNFMYCVRFCAAYIYSSENKHFSYNILFAHIF